MRIYIRNYELTEKEKIDYSAISACSPMPATLIKVWNYL